MNVIVKKAGKKGKGVYALKNFRKGELILNMDKSDKFSDKEMGKMSQHALSHSYTLGSGVNFHMKSPEKFINHSCDPNAFDRQGKVFAMRAIKTGEEITYDYSISADDTWWMKCKCRSENCRKTVKGKFSSLPKETQKKYLPYLESWYKKKFKKEVSELKKSGIRSNTRR